MELRKKDWILIALRQTPLDRIHIMKMLFLIWHRSGRKLLDYFEFVPYLYGPCSFEVYSILDRLQAEGYIVQPPHPMPQWVNYYLTEKARREADVIAKTGPLEIVRFIEEVAKEVSQLDFSELLRKVYAEAPDFAANSIFRGVAK